MRTDYLIFESKYFSARKHRSPNYICYRTVICHALFIKLKHTSVLETKTVFYHFYQSVLNKKEYDDDENFIELFPINMHDKIGYLLVDKSKGTYPLVLYPYSKESVSSRKTALEEVMVDLHSKLDSIIEELNKHDEWNLDLQNHLQENVFSYKECEEEGLY